MYCAELSSILYLPLSRTVHLRSHYFYISFFKLKQSDGNQNIVISFILSQRWVRIPVSSVECSAVLCRCTFQVRLNRLGAVKMSKPAISMVCRGGLSAGGAMVRPRGFSPSPADWSLGRCEVRRGEGRGPMLRPPVDADHRGPQTTHFIRFFGDIGPFKKSDSSRNRLWVFWTFWT